MRVTVIGTGYVGLVVGTCLADLSNNVMCIDVDKNKIDKLQSGIIPIYEPGLDEMLKRNIAAARISFSTKIRKGIEYGDVIFIAVGTPPDKDHRADLKFVRQVSKDIGTYMNSYKVVVNKSTVPVTTGDMVEEIIRKNQREKHDFDVVSNPEFLKEGSAIDDFLHPERIVLGTNSQKAKDIMSELYGRIAKKGSVIIYTDRRSAEIIKYASNSMIAARISFINEISQLCDEVGADIECVARGMGLDSRIGQKYLRAGAGYGGSCFPKDVNALHETMQDYGINATLLKAIEDVNANQKRNMVKKLLRLVDDPADKTIAILGLAFKPETDDMREAPSIIVIDELQRLGARIRAYDPIATEVAKTLFKDVTYCPSALEAAKGCHAVMVLTEWDEFKKMDTAALGHALLEKNIVDCRNIYDPAKLKAQGFRYIGVGRQ